MFCLLSHWANNIARTNGPAFIVQRVHAVGSCEGIQEDYPGDR